MLKCLFLGEYSAVKSIGMLLRISTSSRRLFSSKVYPSSMAALEGIERGASMFVGGFGLSGIPENLLQALKQKGTKDLVVYTNDAGVDVKNAETFGQHQAFGVGLLLESNQVKKIVSSYLGEFKTFSQLWKKGNVELNLVPQGTLAEKLRAGGAGIPAFYTPSGVGTSVQEGNFVVKYNSKGEVEKVSQPKEARVFNGKEYLLEESVNVDVALIKAWKGDKNGNLVFRATAQNFNPDGAKAARLAIAEVEELVEVGELKPDEIQLPGIYIHRIVKGEHYPRYIERLRTRPRPGQTVSRSQSVEEGGSSESDEIREKIGRRAGMEFKDGMYVNLGIGIPTVSSNYIPQGVTVQIQSENGLLGMGPYPYDGEEDSDLVNAGKETVSYLPGSSVFCSSESFSMIRGCHIDLTMLGTLEVSQKGDIANWIIPGKMVKGMGGAMDLVSACHKVIVTTSHTTRNGKPKILKECDLPITGRAVADMIITELAVFKVRRGVGLELVEIAEGSSLDEIRAKTDAEFTVSPNLKVIPQG